MLDRLFLGSSAEATDPNFENVTLLLPGNGSNGAQNNTFLDSSTNNFTVTRNGNTTQGSFSPFNPSAPYDPAVNGGSGYFDGSGDYLSAPAGSAWAFGTGDFTVECWVYFAPGSNIARITNRQPGNARAGTWGFNFSPTSFAFTEVVAGEPGVTASGLPPMTSAWTHLVACRSGSTLRLFANGVQVGSGTNTTNFSDTAYPLGIGAAYETAMAGYISNVRIVKGTALYTAAFTPPTAPVTAVANTQLLCNFTNAGIVDASAKNDLVTVGNAQISTAQSKFGGSSMYFDGSGDYLSIPDSAEFDFGTGNFTVEAWVYHTISSGTSQAYFTHTTGGFGFSRNNAGALVASQASVADITSGGSIPLNAWTHIAVCRTGTSLSIFINGTAASTVTNNTNFNGTTAPQVGAAGGSLLMNGYIDDLRITKGVARYTANFTPPTAPFVDK